VSAHPQPVPPADARLAAAEAELKRVIRAVEKHRRDRRPGKDARLYSAVLSSPLAVVDNRADDPNDWPAP
jgi:hypothetical protein